MSDMTCQRMKEAMTLADIVNRHSRLARETYAKGYRDAKRDRLEALQAENEKLRGVLQNVHDDLIQRAKAYSKDGKTVAVGASVWVEICTALKGGET